MKNMLKGQAHVLTLPKGFAREWAVTRSENLVRPLTLFTCVLHLKVKQKKKKTKKKQNKTKQNKKKIIAKKTTREHLPSCHSVFEGQMIIY